MMPKCCTVLMTLRIQGAGPFKEDWEVHGATWRECARNGRENSGKRPYAHDRRLKNQKEYLGEVKVKPWESLKATSILVGFVSTGA